MYNSQPNPQVAILILQLEHQIQILQQLVSSLKFAEQTRTQRPPYGPTGYPQYPINTNPQYGYTDLDRPIWDRPASQSLTGQMGGSYTDRMTERAEAFRFFEQHKDALSPIQNLFNQSMTNGFANAFGPRAEKANTKPSFLVTQVKGKSDVEGHFNLLGFVYDVHGNRQPDYIEKTLNVLDLPENIRQPKIDVRLPTDYYRTVWILTADTALSLLEIEGVLMNEIIAVCDLGNYPNANVIHDYREAMEDIPFDGNDLAKAKQETPVTEFTELKHDLTEWLITEPWVINNAQLIDSDVLRLDMLSTNSDKRHVLMITNDFLMKWFDTREDYDVNGNVLHALYKEMLKDPNKVVTVVTFKNLGRAILQVLGNSEDGVPSLFTTDYKRAKRFIEKAFDQNLRWFKVD